MPIHGSNSFGLLHPGVKTIFSISDILHRSLHASSAGHCFYSLCTIVHHNTLQVLFKDFVHLNHPLVFKNYFTVFQPLIHHQSLSLSIFTTQLQEGQGAFAPVCHFPAALVIALGLVCIWPALVRQPIAEEQLISCFSLSAALLQQDSPWLWPSCTSSRLFRVVRSPAVKS